MATTRKKKSEESGSSEERTLPLPRQVLQHHGEALFPLMTQWKEQGKVPPVLLLTGPDGIGKRRVVHYLAQWLLCERSGPAGREDEGDLFGGADLLGGGASVAGVVENNSGPPAPCGECGSCLRALSGNWIDFAEIGPDEEKSKSGAIRIEQFRELKASMGFGAHGGAYRITHIDQADRMTTQAANSLLKLLEEPPAQWVFFLTAGDPSLLLPTIVSRCQRLRLRPFSSGVLRELLQEEGQHAPARVEACVRLAHGSWERARQLLGEETWEKRAALVRFLRRPREEMGGLADWAATETPHLAVMVDQMEQLTSELIGWSLSPDRVSFSDEALKQHAQAAVRRWGSAAAARRFWLKRAEDLAEARHYMTTPMSKKLLAQELLLPWLEI